MSRQFLASGSALLTVLSASACSHLKMVHRRDPLSRVLIGGNQGGATNATGSETSGSIARIDYVPGAKASPGIVRRDGGQASAEGGEGWVWRLGGSAQQWDIDDSGSNPHVLFRDIELFLRQPDLLSARPETSQRFRLAAQIGTFYSQYEVEGLSFGPTSTTWHAIPLASYRVTIEPEVLLAFGESWELCAFANGHGAAGLAYPMSSGGYYTSGADYDLTYLTDIGFEAGLRAAIGPVMGQLSFQARQVVGGSSSASSDSGFYDPINAESSTIEGVWIIMGVAF